MEKREEVLKVLCVAASESVTADMALWGREAEPDGIDLLAVEEGLSLEVKDKGRADLGILVVIWGA